MSENPARQKISRYVDIHRYFVCELVKAVFVKLIPLRTHEIVADVLTKSLPIARLHQPPPRHDGPNTFCFQVIAR